MHDYATSLERADVLVRCTGLSTNKYAAATEARAGYLLLNVASILFRLICRRNTDDVWVGEFERGASLTSQRPFEIVS
jgi:hypothetical protein